MKELLTSEDFARYRKKQIEVVVKFLKARFFDDKSDPAYLRGAIEMGRKLIRLPEDLLHDKKYKAQMDSQIQEDLNRLIVEMTREDFFEI